VLAAKILGHTGDITRFATAQHYASYTGTAPVEASSGDIRRHRLCRAGNRCVGNKPCTIKQGCVHTGAPCIFTPSRRTAQRLPTARVAGWPIRSLPRQSRRTEMLIRPGIEPADLTNLVLLCPPGVRQFRLCQRRCPLRWGVRAVAPKASQRRGLHLASHVMPR
jgi:hypothetical protein